MVRGGGCFWSRSHCLEDGQRPFPSLRLEHHGIQVFAGEREQLASQRFGGGRFLTEQGGVPAGRQVDAQHQQIAGEEVELGKIKWGGLADAQAAPGDLRVVVLAGFSGGQVEDVGRPRLGGYELAAAQHAQHQPPNEVLSLAGGAHVALHQGLVKRLGGGADGRSQRSAALVEALDHLGDELVVITGGERNIPRKRQVEDQRVVFAAASAAFGRGDGQQARELRPLLAFDAVEREQCEIKLGHAPIILVKSPHGIHLASQL